MEPLRAATAVDTSKPDAGFLDRLKSEHVVQFYEDDKFLRDAAAGFLAAGLVAGDLVVIIASEAHRRDFLEGLEERGIDVARAREANRIQLLDVNDGLAAILKDGMPDRQRFRALLDSVTGAVDRTRVRAYGEMVDVLWRQDRQEAALRLEELWNEYGRDRPLALLCAYVIGNFYQEAHSGGFRAVCDAHSHVQPAESYSSHADLDTRLREISRLQQRARALETELSQRKQLEDDLRAARAEAEAASRAKDEFLAMLGHELRNPLSPILTALELMKLRGDGRTAREQEIIDRQTRHLIRLVDDLLDVARITRGAVELRKQVVELRDVLAKATEIASPLLEQRRQHFEIAVPPRDIRLHADEARLSQVVANLMTNAARYTPPGGHIRLEARAEGGDAVIEVQDDGIGIAAELLPRIFDLFVRGRHSADRAEGGLGIGLALVRSLVALHGGSVQARSAGPGQGSTFTVRLPALATGERGLGAGGSTALPLQKKAAHGRRVLVVDDNEDALEMLCEILGSAGHEVQSASSGPSALLLVREFRPEVAILDIGLPAMDGYELAARLRAEMGVHAPCMMALTGYGQEADRARSQAAGFALHLVKPLEVSDLLDTIERATGKP